VSVGGAYYNGIAWRRGGCIIMGPRPRSSLKFEWDIVTRLPGICGVHYKSTTSTVVRTSSPDIFKFYSYLKDRVPHVPLSPEEKRITSGEIELSSVKLGELVKACDTHQQSLKNAFSRQQEKAAVSGCSLKWLCSFHRCI